VQGVQVHPQKLCIVENPCKILENLGKIPDNLGKIPENPSKNGVQRCLISKYGVQPLHKNP